MKFEFVILLGWYIMVPKSYSNQVNFQKNATNLKLHILISNQFFCNESLRFEHFQYLADGLYSFYTFLTTSESNFCHISRRLSIGFRLGQFDDYYSTSGSPVSFYFFKKIILFLLKYGLEDANELRKTSKSLCKLEVLDCVHT